MEKYRIAGQTTNDNTHNKAHALACWITKATNTHSACVTFITFPQQQWLYECALKLRFYVICLSCFSIVIQPEFEADHSPTSNEVMQEYALLLAVTT